ncbi:putative SAGE1-like protein, partial [Vicugna pacos]
SGHRSQPVEGARGSAGGSGLRALGGWPRGSRGGSLSRLQRLQCPVARGGCRQQLWPAASLEPSRAVEHQLVEVMSDEAEEFAVGPENQMELCGEPESPSLSEEKPGMGLLPMKQDEEGESHSGALSMSGEDKYERAFTLLDGAQGSLEVRTQYVEFAIKEAARFKRADLIKHLEKLREQKDSERFLNTGDCTPKI